MAETTRPILTLLKSSAPQMAATLRLRRTRVALRFLLVTLSSLILLVSSSAPASAQTDTTPPQLVSFSIAPDIVDDTTNQTVTVNAVITDDSSGVWEDTQVQLLSPSGDEEVYAFFEPNGVDSYMAVLTIPAFSEAGIWKDWNIWLIDNYDNEVLLEYDDLLARGLNLAVAVGSYDTSYPRSVSLKVRGTRASGVVESDPASTCSWFVPVSLQRKTKTGWRKVDTTLSHYQGDFSFYINQPKKVPYRAIAAEFGIGTPSLTTCEKASIIRQSKKSPTRWVESGARAWRT